MKVIGIREFNRKMYDYIDSLPLLVVNKWKRKKIFLILDPKVLDEEGGEMENGKLCTSSSLQS